MAVDARAFTREGRPRDHLIVEAGEDEGIYLAEFDTEAIRKYRQTEAWGNAFRKPRAYSALSLTEVTASFSRYSAR